MAKGKAKVKAASISTNNDKRDAHLKGADFFDVEKYPELTYEVEKFKAAGKNKYKAEGKLTMHGVTKPVEFSVDFKGTEKDPWGNMRASFVATTKVNRKDFGIKWNKVLDSGGLLVGDDVEVKLQIEGIEQKSDKKDEAKK